MDNEKATIKISRFGTAGFEKEHFATYITPFKDDWSVLDALNYIYIHLDGTLIHPYSCKSGVCTVCAVEVNGKKVLACKTPMLKEMTIRPANENKIARDLVEK